MSDINLANFENSSELNKNENNSLKNSKESNQKYIEINNKKYIKVDEFKIEGKMYAIAIHQVSGNIKEKKVFIMQNGNWCEILSGVDEQYDKLTKLLNSKIPTSIELEK